MNSIRPLAVGIAALALACAACAPQPPVVPDELIGRWQTDYERYADRFVEIGAHTIAFGIGGDDRTEHTIVGLAAAPHPRGTLFTFEYRGEGESTLTLGVHLDPAAGPALRLRNQSGFEWTRRARSQP